MRLSSRLTLPFLVVALLVTAAGVTGAVWIANRTMAALLAQEGRQLGRIAENALAQEAQPLSDAAEVMAFVEGGLPDRLAAWRKVRLDAAGLVPRDPTAAVSWTGDPIDPGDLAGLRAAAPGRPVLLRGRLGLLVAGLAVDRDKRTLVVAARRLGLAFRASLRNVLQAGITVAGPGVPPWPEIRNAGEVLVPVTHSLLTAGGATVILTMHLPGDRLREARRRAVGFSLAGGVLLLGLGALFYIWMLSRVTRPLEDLMNATDRMAAGQLGVSLPPDAPAELGDLARKFNAMGASLREAQDRLVRSAKLTSVGSLVAGVSHELNNPLSVLLAHAEHQATLVSPGAPGREELDVVIEQGRRMQKILSDLRGLIRPGTEAPGPVDLNAVAREAASLVRHEAVKAGVTCETVLAPGEVLVTASADDLRQVALNLAINALQAMPEGGRLTIRTGRTTVAARRLHQLIVEDTGHGIAPEDLARVTEPFFSTKPGRLGLGLAISQDLARRHGGTLSIESSPERGTMVTLEFPA